MCVCMLANKYAYMHVCLYVCYMYVCLNACTYLCMHACMYATEIGLECTWFVVLVIFFPDLNIQKTC